MVKEFFQDEGKYYRNFNILEGKAQGKVNM